MKKQGKKKKKKEQKMDFTWINQPTSLKPFCLSLWVPAVCDYVDLLLKPDTQLKYQQKRRNGGHRHSKAALFFPQPRTKNQKQ